MRLRPCELAILLVAFAVGCQRPADVAPASPASPQGEPVRPDPPTVVGLLREAVALGPGDARTQLSKDAPSSVDRVSSFRVVLSRRSSDARLSLIDANDALVPSLVSRELTDTTTLTLKPADALSSRIGYVLRVDGASTAELHDEAGTGYAPLQLRVLADPRGEPPEPLPKNKRHR